MASENLNQWEFDSSTRMVNPYEGELKLRVYFRDIKSALISRINEAEVVLGAVAWLTDFDILESLANVQSAIVVNKEDFLRPEGDGSSWKSKLRAAYEKLSFYFDRFQIGGLPSSLSYCGDTTIQPVRCVGQAKKNYTDNVLRMHNKFLVFCRWPGIHARYTDEVGESFVDPGLEPVGVWTGSFNFTANASRCLENAIYTNDLYIARAYYEEWKQILALSEPLDWTSEFVQPEWRIGS